MVSKADVVVIIDFWLATCPFIYRGKEMDLGEVGPAFENYVLRNLGLSLSLSAGDP